MTEESRLLIRHRRRAAARELADIPLAVAMLRTLIGYGFVILSTALDAPHDEVTMLENLIDEIHAARVAPKEG